VCVLCVFKDEDKIERHNTRSHKRERRRREISGSCRCGSLREALVSRGGKLGRLCEKFAMEKKEGKKERESKEGTD
jgi:hypothetical protein